MKQKFLLNASLVLLLCSTSGFISAQSLIPKSFNGAVKVTKTNVLHGTPSFNSYIIRQKDDLQTKSNNVQGNKIVQNVAKKTTKVSQEGVQSYSATDNSADSLLLYGLNYRTDDYTTTSTLPTSIYSFHNASHIAYINEAKGKDILNTDIAFYAKGKFYAFESTPDDDGNYTNSAVIYDTNTWKVIGHDTLNVNNLLMWPSSYDPITDRVYAFAWSADWKKELFSIDLNTMKADSITKTDGYITALAAGPDGKLYAASRNDCKLYTIDKTNGTFNAIGDLGFDMQIGIQSMTFDWATGKLYYVGQTQNDQTHLYKVNTTTGSTTLVADMPGGEKIAGLYIPYTADNAPAAPTGISFKYDADGDLTSTLKFNVPSKTYKGETLAGELSAYITIDNEIDTVSVTAGSFYSTKKTLSQGMHTVQVQFENNVGKSPLRKFTTFAGTDAPGEVGNLNFTLDDSRVATVKWDASTTSRNGGYMDFQSIKYRVIREPNDVVVSESQKETSFTETLEDARAHYYYKVIALNDTDLGDTVISNTITMGSQYVPPFKETFDTSGDFGLWTIAGNAGWNYDEESHCSSWTANDDGGKKICDEDYLTSIPIKLGISNAYKLTFSAMGTYPYADVAPSLRVFLSKSKDPGSPTSIELDSVYVDNNDAKKFNVVFTVPVAGLYYISFNAVNDVTYNLSNINIDNVEVLPNAKMTAPDGVMDLSVAAGAKGALNDTITFKAPTETYNGDVLSSISKIELYKGESDNYTLLKEFTAPTVGEKLTYIDNNAGQGFNQYHLIAYSEEGYGREVSITKYVGIDTPLDIPVFKIASKDYTKAVLTWAPSASIGENDGYVDTSAVSYRVYRYSPDLDNYVSIADKIDGSTYTDDTYEISAGQQEYVSYAIVAFNKIGQSHGKVVGVDLGTPYTMPYQESFTNAGLDTNPWTNKSISGTPSWSVANGLSTNVKPHDEDGGMITFGNSGETPALGSLMGPRISMKDNKKPILSFYMYHGSEAEEGDLSMRVLVSADDADTVQVANINYNDGTTGWQRHVISLDQFKDADNVILHFEGYALDASATIFMDQVRIENQYDKDLTVVSATAPSRIHVGTAATASVLVLNKGGMTTGDYKVELFRNHEIYASQTATGLGTNNTKLFSFNINTPIMEAGKNYEYYAKVSLDGDEALANDTSKLFNIYINGPKYPKVTDLIGNTADNSVKLKWSKPLSSMQDEMTDDFESYEPYLISGIGDWTTFDGDGYSTLYFTSPTEVPNEFEPQAWQVWNRDKAGYSTFDILKSHSGDQYLASWGSVDDIGNYLPSDNWLISSDIVGGSDVSFWTKKVTTDEVFQFLYSTAGKESTDFTVLGGDSLFTADWVKYEYTLPDNAKYFAIRSCAKGGVVQLLDDVTYTPEYGSSTDLTFKGFNVYRDGVLVAQGITDTTYVDQKAGDESHVYSVSTIWTIGESMLSNEYVSGTNTGVNLINTQKVKVLTQDGAIIFENGDAQIGSVYTLDGRTVFSAPLTNHVSVPVSKGMYIVRVGVKNYKVLVK